MGKTIKLNPKPENQAVKPEPIATPVETLEVSLDDVNGFLSIIGIVLVDDIRSQTLSSHFMKMIQSRNPQIKAQPKQ
mgnify:CR=1 FL=1